MVGCELVPISAVRSSDLHAALLVLAVGLTAQQFGRVKNNQLRAGHAAQILGPHASQGRRGRVHVLDRNRLHAEGPVGQDPDFFAILSWVAADMFVQALTQAGPDPTQAKVLEQMRTFTDYSGDGLVQSINPAQKKQPQCFHVIEVKGGRWVPTFPAKGFTC